MVHVGKKNFTGRDGGLILGDKKVFSTNKG